MKIAIPVGKFNGVFLIKRSWINVIDRTGSLYTMNVLNLVGGDWCCARGTKIKQRKKPATIIKSFLNFMYIFP